MENQKNEKDKQCVCKGIRYCSLCENIENKLKMNNNDYSNKTIVDLSQYLFKQEQLKVDYTIEAFCLKNENELNSLFNQIESNKHNILNELPHIQLSKLNIFDGFYTIKSMITESESKDLINKINTYEWSESQSGRKKQDFSPKINYKRKKVKKINEFEFPIYTDSLKDKINSVEFLSDFEIAGIGNLYYNKQKGAHIQPHIDDYWIWGNRIVGINLLSDTIITFTQETKDIVYELNFPIKKNEIYIMSDLSRYIWKHSIKKENINDERLVITIREFEKSYFNNTKI